MCQMMPSSSNLVSSAACVDKSKFKEKDDTARPLHNHKWKKERCSSAGANVANNDDCRDSYGGRHSLPPKAPSASGRLQRERRAVKSCQSENIPRLPLPLEDETKTEDIKEWFVPNLPVESASDGQLRKCQTVGLQRTTLTYSEVIPRSSHVAQKIDVKKGSGESPTKNGNPLESRQSKSSLNALIMDEEESPRDYNYDGCSTNQARKDNLLSNKNSMGIRSAQGSLMEELDAEEYGLDNWRTVMKQEMGKPSSIEGNIISSIENNDIWTKEEASDTSCCSLSQEDSEVEELHYFTSNQCNSRHPANSPLKRPLMHDFNTSRSEPIFSPKPTFSSKQSPLILPQRSVSAPSLPACHHAELVQKWSVSANNGEFFLSCNVVQLMTILVVILFAYLIYIFHFK